MKKRRMLLSYLERLWVTDIALTALLVFLLIHTFILYPLRGQVTSAKLLTFIFFSLILISGAIAASRSRILRTLVFSWGLLTFIFLWIKYLFPLQAVILVTTCLALFYLVLLTFLILAQAFREGPTTSHRIMGAVAAYLLLGLIWALIYNAITLHIPGAFKGLEAFTEGDSEVLYTHFQYFSFTVLTTVGFGDIVPVDPIARMATVLEGVAGQLFPAILIARLVSLQVQSKRKT
jgi:hypothetical protein